MIKKGIILCVLVINSNCNDVEKNRSTEPVPAASVLIDSPESRTARTPQFTGLDTLFLSEPSPEQALKEYKKVVKNLNPSHKNIWQRKYWNIDYYNDKNLPVIVGTLNDTQSFSSRYREQGLRFLDLPIYMPGQGWRIPTELEQLKQVIKMAVDHERLCMPDFEKNHYVYITVDQGWVEPHTSQRRAGWHGDSYRKIDSHKTPSHTLVDHVYVVCDACPTLFLEGPFPLDGVNPEDVDAVQKKFADLAKDKKRITYPSYTLLRLDPYCVHDAGINTGNDRLYRTFVKISFSKTKYAHLGNAHNNLFTYDWPMVPRHKVPYTRDAIVHSSHRKDRDQFTEIDPTEIDFLHKQSGVPWANSIVHTVVKNGYVTVEPAKEGDLIESKNEKFVITINVAKKGDYKVTFNPGDTGFIDPKRFHEKYSPDPLHKDRFFPKKVLRRAVQLTQNVRMQGPWGTLQYASAGDYLVYVHDTEIYFVPKPYFAATYEILD